MDYKLLLTNYLLSVDATAGSVVYQPCDGLLEVCQTQDAKQELLRIVQNSDITLLENAEDSAYQELVDWSKETDILLESSNGVLFCIPSTAA